ncbi:unnamed protein product [Linum trigynum]|uniref:Uncharacterized protein n=1 Tax=Linum trigynum TaxID=586398 RepID=A0AAV2FTR5_9ROSI
MMPLTLSPRLSASMLDIIFSIIHSSSSRFDTFKNKGKTKIGLRPRCGASSLSSSAGPSLHGRISKSLPVTGDLPSGKMGWPKFPKTDVPA